MHLQTKAIHTGVDKDTAYNSVITPIYQTSTFRFADVGKTLGYDYTRTSNPTRKALEENIASLEGGVGAVAVATGMAAIATVLHLFKSGDHIICTHDCYGGPIGFSGPTRNNSTSRSVTSTSTILPL